MSIVKRYKSEPSRLASGVAQEGLGDLSLACNPLHTMNSPNAMTRRGQRLSQLAHQTWY